MKKIYFILVILSLGFVANYKARGLCEYCQYPYICNYINYVIVCNGQTYPIQAVICYNCDYNNRAYYIQVLEISYPAELERIIYDPNNPNPQCEDALWDSLWANVRRRAFELCGYSACMNWVTIYKTIPLCGEFIYEGPVGHEYVRKRFHPGDCNLRCLKEIRICYDYDNNNFVENLISTQYLGYCPLWAIYPFTSGLTPPIRIECAELWPVRICP